MTSPSPSPVTDDGLVERVAMSMCAEMYGPLEDGSWALLGDHGKDSLRRCARAALAASDRDVLVGILKRWLALDGGNWLVDRHARETEELRTETRAALIPLAGEL